MTLINEPENSAFDTYIACSGYLELLSETYEPDMQAFESCLDNSIAGDGTNALRFCRLLADSGNAVPPTLQEKCLNGAKAYVHGDLFTKEYSQARDKFLQAVRENMPFVDPQETQRIAEQIYNTQFFDQSVDLLNKIALAVYNCESEAAPVEEFWQGIQTYGLSDAVTEPLIEATQRMIQDIDRHIGEGNVHCANNGMTLLARLLEGGPVPDSVKTEVTARLAAWLSAADQQIENAAYIDAFSLLQGVQALAQLQGDPGEADKKIADLVERFAHLPQTQQTIQDKTAYLCTQEGLRYDPGYYDFLKKVFDLNLPVKGKFLNCTENQLSDEFLPTSLAELRYMISETSFATSSEPAVSCAYSGGYTLEFVTADYQITVTEIGSGKQVAETRLPSITTIECQLFHTFISNVDRYHLPLAEADLITWLSSLDLP